MPGGTRPTSAGSWSRTPGTGSTRNSPPNSPRYFSTSYKPSPRSVFAPGVDDALRDVHQPGVAGLRKFAEQFECTDGVHPEALHDDALGLTDEVSGGERGLQLFTLTAGQDSGGGVRRQHGADRLRLGVERIGLESKEVERACGLVAGVKLERQAAADTHVHGAARVLRPPAFAREIVGTHDQLGNGRFPARGVLDF